MTRADEAYAGWRLRLPAPEKGALYGASPTVTVKAAHAKRRGEDTLPLRADTATTLRAHLAGKMADVRAFRMPHRANVASVLRSDLADAGIDYIDSAGRYADFHSLRGTFATALARADVHPRVAQDLLRHSDINLTMGIYTQLTATDQGRAIDSLPSLDADPVEDRETGTDG